jgi:hypothetical protein
MSVLKEQIFKACRHFMRPIVRFLLRNGVTWDEFSELSKDIYVDVARDDYGIQGRPTNNSRVAMMTGLSRREVARIRDRLIDDADNQIGRRGNRISEILTAWHMDAEFTDDAGQPKDLPSTGPTGSLSALLKRYAGDLPHGALVKEMQQRDLIAESESGLCRVLKRDYVYTTLDPEIVNQMSVSLHDHAATLDHNLNSARKTPPRFEGIADNARISARSAKAFTTFVETHGLDFLNEIDGWLLQHEVDDNKSTDTREVRLGVGVYLIQEDTSQRQNK